MLRSVGGQLVLGDVEYADGSVGHDVLSVWRGSYSVILSTERSFYKRLHPIAQPVKNFLYNRNKKLPLFFSASFLVYCGIQKTTLATKPNRSIRFPNDNQKIIKK